ncbi:MAG: hypothetical protein KME13_21745 [Myxacorys californica WJT36-NPBG1]|nr:hypothetical protein [Myxacorys californica WJT36-NPBG1]
MPVTFLLTVGQRNEAVEFDALMEQGEVKRVGRGRPRLRPQRVAGDNRRGIGVVIPRRNYTIGAIKREKARLRLLQIGLPPIHRVKAFSIVVLISSRSHLRLNCIVAGGVIHALLLNAILRSLASPIGLAIYNFLKTRDVPRVRLAQIGSEGSCIKLKYTLSRFKLEAFFLRR